MSKSRPSRRLPDGSLVNTQHLDLPWPISDRVYKIAVVNSADAAPPVPPGQDADAVPPVWSSSWTHVKGFGNIDESRGAWRVFPCGEAALVEYQVLTDPGGQIPTYFKNKATGRSLRRLDRGRPRAGRRPELRPGGVIGAAMPAGTPGARPPTTRGPSR